MQLLPGKFSFPGKQLVKMNPLTLILYALCLVPTSTGAFDESVFAPYHQSYGGSPALLRKLAEKEEIIYLLIKDYHKKLVLPASVEEVNQNPWILPLLESFVGHFEGTTARQLLQLKNSGESVPYRPNNVAWNPLATYHMFRRYNGVLRSIVRTLNTAFPDQFALQKQILEVMKDIGWPLHSDLKLAMSSIVRLEYVYDLNTSDITSGILDGTDTGVFLSANDCHEIGLQAIEDGHFALAVEWMEEAIENHYFIPVFEALQFPSFVRKYQLDRSLQMTIDTHDRESDQFQTWDARFFVSKVKDVPINKIRRRTTELEKWKGGRTSNLNDINYWGVCSGENYKTEPEKSKLVCWYEVRSHAYWRINPLKAELLSLEPLYIVQFFDLIGPKLIEQIKADASPRLARSLVFDGADQIVSSFRTSLNTWIKDNKEPRFQNLPRTIELITGLSVLKNTSSEELQVASYSGGSHYSVHLDGFDRRPPEGVQQIGKLGNRIATLIYYLSEVGQGGGTAFPQSGLATTPTKGSAVLWYNINRSGEVDPNSWHGSCPVIIGEKWIANKWMRSNDQMFFPRYKCVKDQQATFDIFMNGRAIRTL